MGHVLDLEESIKVSPESLVHLAEKINGGAVVGVPRAPAETCAAERVGGSNAG